MADRGIKFTDTSCENPTGKASTEIPAVRSGSGPLKFVDDPQAGGIGYDSVHGESNTPPSGSVKWESPVDAE